MTGYLERERMRRAARIDDNQNEIVKALRNVGASVAITSQMGKGFPDIVVGYRGLNFLFEIKDGNKVPSKRKLTDDEVQFFGNWHGQVDIVESIDDALKIIGAIK